MNRVTAISPFSLDVPESPKPEIAAPREIRPPRSLRRSRTVRAVYARAFRVMQSFGVSVTPVHSYFPVPNLNHLNAKTWPGGPGEAAIHFDVPSQLVRLENWQPYIQECDFAGVEGKQDHEFHLGNGFFETVDAEIAYSIVRERKPRRIIEVGGGNSTRLLATALRKNAEEGYAGELASIEPEPDDILRRGFPGLTKLFRMRVQDIPLGFFEQLEAGDILFLDSSHVVALGSDVVFEILEILPRLKPGVVVHFHDIFMPAEYPQKFVMNNLCFWGEQYMLQAFMCGNKSFRVIWASSIMHMTYPNVLSRAIPQWPGSYERMSDDLKMFVPSFDDKNVWPCSFWVEKSQE